MHTLSVVIITRNESGKIARGIESVLKATAGLQAVEILLVDSASSDNTVAIARQYPIKIIEIPENAFLSPAAGRYIGMQHSDGKYLYFLDGDMWLDADWFKVALPRMDANPRLAAVAGKCHEISFNEAGEQVSENLDRFYVGDQVREVRHLGQSVLYRRAVLEAVGGFNPYLTNEEELELGLRISAAGYELQRIPVPMTIHYTQFYSLENPSGLTVRQIKRDWNLGRHIALGQVLRLLLGNPFIGEFLGIYKRALFFTALYKIGILALLIALFTHQALYFALWMILMLTLFLLRALFKRDLSDTGLYFLDYLLCSYGFMRGFWRRIPPASSYRPAVRVSMGG